MTAAECFSTNLHHIALSYAKHILIKKNTIASNSRYEYNDTATILTGKKTIIYLSNLHYKSIHNICTKIAQPFSYGVKGRHTIVNSSTSYLLKLPFNLHCVLKVLEI